MRLKRLKILHSTHRVYLTSTHFPDFSSPDFYVCVGLYGSEQVQRIRSPGSSIASFSFLFTCSSIKKLIRACASTSGVLPKCCDGKRTSQNSFLTVISSDLWECLLLHIHDQYQQISSLIFTSMSPIYEVSSEDCNANHHTKRPVHCCISDVPALMNHSFI